jgi:hypothetical protein
MEKAFATLRNGQVELDETVDWAEGTRLEVSPTPPKLGLGESEWPKTPEERAAWVEWLNSLEPFDMTPEELAAFEAGLKASKEKQKALLRQSWEENP